MCIGLKGPYHQLGPTSLVKLFMLKGTADIWDTLIGGIVNTRLARSGGHTKPNSRTETEWVPPDFRTSDKASVDRDQEPAMALFEQRG